MTLKRSGSSKPAAESKWAGKLFDAFSAKDWCTLLAYRPEFASVCRWEKIDPKTCNVVNLLKLQPQFSERINIVEFCDGDGVKDLVDEHPELIYKIPEDSDVDCSCARFYNYEGIAEVIDEKMIDAFRKRLRFDWKRPLRFKWLVAQKPELRDFFDISLLGMMDWGDMIAVNPDVAAFCPFDMSCPNHEIKERLKGRRGCLSEYESHHWILSRWEKYIPFSDFRRDEWDDDWKYVLERGTRAELARLESIVPWKQLSAADWSHGIFKNWPEKCDAEWLINEIRGNLDNDDGVSMVMDLLETCPSWAEEHFQEVLNRKLPANGDNSDAWLRILKVSPTFSKYMKSFKRFAKQSLRSWELTRLIAEQPSIVDQISHDFTPPAWATVLRYRPDLAKEYEKQCKTWGNFMLEHWVEILIGDPSLLAKFKGKLVKDSFAYSAF